MPQILLVDDDPYALSELQDICDEMGYECTLAANGREAYDCVNSETFRLVVTDLVMPEMGGLEFIKEVRKSDAKLPVIALSGFAGDLDQAKKMGANLGFFKPYQIHEIKSAIRIYLEK